MIINGETVTLTTTCSLGQFVDKRKYRRDRIAVELNGQILSKDNYDSTTLRDDDIIEIVQFIGGG